MEEIGIIGGGASGMAAALQAARLHPEVRVTVLERQGRVGRKLLATGNGRCNLTNTRVALERYHGGNPEFALPALRAYPPERVLAFFAELGLRTVTEYGGRVFPMSDSATSVLDVLRLALDRAGVSLCANAGVTALEACGGGYTVRWPGGERHFRQVIVACGGCAGGKLGGVTDGYRLLEGLGHSRTALYPALTSLRTAPEFPRALKGIRVRAGIAIARQGRVLADGRGDVLFTETGLSGSGIFDLSRAVAGAGNGLEAVLDFFPDTGEMELVAELRRRRREWKTEPGNRVFTGTVPNRLGLMLCKRAGVSGSGSIGALTERQLTALAETAKGLRLPITGVGGFDGAQITAGGIRTGEFYADTLESRLAPGVRACGELLDIDGDCGGYNLQWAWASGLLAGELG